MKSTLRKALRIRLVQLAPALAIAVVILADARPASAGCFMKLKDCYLTAANQSDWLDQWLMGLDCELDAVDCVRRAILGH